MKKIFFFLFTVMLFGVTDAYALTWNIQGKTFNVDTISHFYVGPGTTRTTLKLTSGSRKQVVYYTTTDLTDPNATIRLCMAHDGIWGVKEEDGKTESTKADPSGDEVLSKMITHKKGLISGVNADFFGNVKDYRYPKTIFYRYPQYGHVISDGETYHMRYKMAENTFNLTSEKIPLFGTAEYTATITANGKTRKLTSVNTHRKDDTDNTKDEKITDFLVLYTNRLKTKGHGTVTNTSGSEAYLKIVSGEFKSGSTLELEVESVRKNLGNTAVTDANHYVLSGYGAGQTFVDNLKIGSVVEINSTLLIAGKRVNDVMQSVGGKPMLLKDGVILETQGALDHLIKERGRTAVGVSKDRERVVLFVADGDGMGGSRGLTSKEVATIMKYIGCTEAMNFDGGGSSEMYDKNFGIINDPSDGFEREVINGLFVATADPKAVDDNTIASIKFVDWAKKLQTGNTYTPIVYGYNKYGVLINKEVHTLDKFSLECPENLGTIFGKSLKVGKYKGTYALTAKYGTASVALPVTITNGELPPTPGPDPEPDPTPTPDPNPIDPNQEEMLTQITAEPIATCTGSNGDQATFANGKLWIYNKDTKETYYYKYDNNGGFIKGNIKASGVKGKGTFAIDDANHLITRTMGDDGIWYFDIFTIDNSEKGRTWETKFKVQSNSYMTVTDGNYIEAVGDIMIGGYLLLTSDGYLNKIKKGSAPVSSSVLNVLEQKDYKTYLNYIGNGKFLVNSQQGRYFICNADGSGRSNIGQNVLGEVFEKTNRAGKVRMNTLGGCYVNLSGKDIYFYNTYENDNSEKKSLRFTGCVVNGRTMGTAGTKPQGGYYYNPTLLDSTSFTTAPEVNFMFADKKSETECLIYQYSPADNTVRCYKVNTLSSNDVLTATVAEKTEVETATQTKKFKELKTESDYTYLVISGLKKTLTLTSENSNAKLLSVSGRVNDKDDNVIFDGINSEDGNVTLTGLGCRDYKYRYDAKYTWYGADLGKTIQQEVAFKPDYNAAPLTGNPTGEVFLITDKVGNVSGAQVVFDFNVPESVYPVSEYRVYVKNGEKESLISTVRGNINNQGVLLSEEVKNKWNFHGEFMTNYSLDNVKTMEQAQDYVRNNTFVVETVYGSDDNMAVRKTVRTSPFSLKNDIPTSVEGAVVDNDIALNPTLADDVITVSAGEGVHSVAIYSVSGICVSKIACDGSNVQILPVEHLSSGCYLVVVNNEKTLKFIRK